MTRRELIAHLLVGPLVAPALVGASRQSDDLTSLPVSDIVRRIGRHEISVVELTEAYLSRIGRINPALNAFVTVAMDRARADAKRVASLSASSAGRRALPGVPIAHKDLFETKGIRTTAGSRLFEAYVPARDAAVVAILSNAGTVLLGKTNTHELGGGVTTINPFYGTTHNPVDNARIPGGSSGGSAAAVVARLAAAATGSDTGGSVRIPAALCGAVGFKPTFGRIATAGLLGACPTFDHAGVLTRNVEDAMLVFDALTGEPRPVVDWRQPLRIGVARRFFFDALQPDVEAAMARAIERLRAAGLAILDRDLPVDADTMSRVFDPIVLSEIWSRYGDDWRQRPQLFSPAFASTFATARPAAREVTSAHRARAAFQDDVGRAFEDVDVILTPTVPVTAPPITGPIDGALILRNTWPFNAARTPAISIPCGTDRSGLPIGLQLAARVGQDTLLLHVARRFELA